MVSPWVNSPTTAGQGFDGATEMDPYSYHGCQPCSRSHYRGYDDDALRDEAISTHSYDDWSRAPIIVPVIPVYPPVIIAPIGSPPSVPAPAGLWYYCNNPKGYFPYISTCRSPWRQVSAQPVK
jgi:hypothetical protein